MDAVQLVSLNAPVTRDYALVDEAITEVDDNGSVYTAYGVLVCWKGRRFGVYRRFAEFRTLHLALCDHIPGIDFKLWSWPPASWRLDPAIIEKRAIALQEYLSQAVQACSSFEELPPPLENFLSLDGEEAPSMTRIGRRRASHTGVGGSAVTMGDGVDNACTIGRGITWEALASGDPDPFGALVGAGAPTLTRAMRKHLDALKRLQPLLCESVDRASEVEQEGAYEDLDSLSSLCAQMLPPLQVL